MNLQAWRAMWHELGAQAVDEQMHRRLIGCWSEAHRHYHTLRHLRDCLETFEAVRSSALRPAEVELALWFHDACYDPRATDNEQRSADWAHAGALQAGLPAEVAGRVHALVMATRHESTPTEADAQLLVDVDLSILGAAPGRFDESDRQIRAEYAHVPEEDFRAGRGRILRGFLERPRIYSTEHFHSSLEEQARSNLQRALARLGA